MDKDIAVAGGLTVPEATELVDAEPAGSGTDQVAETGGVARRGQRGMVSAEWAVGIVAAIAIAGVLLAVVTTGSVQDALLKFILWVIEMFTTIANTR